MKAAIYPRYRTDKQLPRWPFWARSSSAFQRGEDIKFLRPAIVGLPT